MIEHEHRLRVRYGETDQMGVVYHANYLAYMEEGRTRLMHARGCSYADLERSGFGLAVRRASMRFRAPALYDEELLVRTRIDRVRGASVNFTYAILRAADGTLLCEGETELACIDLRTPERRPCLMPDSLRLGFEA